MTGKEINILLVYNPSSGHFLARVGMEPSAVQDYLQSLLGRCCPEHIRLQAFSGDQLSGWKAEWQHSPPDAIWVAGGDGTVLALAEITTELDIPLGVLPAGTMNLLARDLGMALDLERAIRQLCNAESTYMDMARVNGKAFLCISNLGLASRLTERREHLRQTSGWLRWPLMGWYLLKFVFAYPSMLIELEIHGERRQIRTRAAAISNNPLSGKSWLIPIRNQLDSGQLGIYVTRDHSFWSLPRLTLKLLMGNWQQDQDLQRYTARKLSISFRHKHRVNLMSDGELKRLGTPLDYQIQPRALRVLKPADPGSPAA